MEEPTFLSPWAASFQGLDLAWEIDTEFCPAAPQIKAPLKAKNAHVSFATGVDFYVGHEDDIQMGRWTTHLTSPILSTLLNESAASDDDIDNDLASFMAAVNQNRSSPSGEAPRPLIMSPDIAYQTDEENFDHPAQEAPNSPIDASDAASDVPTEWYPTIIYSLHHDPISAWLDWDDRDETYRHVAANLNIPVDRLLHLQQIYFTPSDLRRLHVEALIAYENGDIPEGADGRAVLIDIEFHSHLPSRTPEVIRRIFLLPGRVQRSGLLQGLGLLPHCTDAAGTELIWHNDDVCRQSHTTWLVLTDGDYVRIALPPHPAEQLQHLPTRFVASARFRGLSVQDVFSNDLMTRLGWMEPGTVMTRSVPTDFDFDLHEEVSLFQTHHSTPVAIAEASAKCRLEHDMTPLRLAAGPDDAGEQRPATGIQDQPPVIQGLHLLWQLNGIIEQGAAEAVLPIQTWFLSFPRWGQCREPRSIALGFDFQTWQQDIFELWRDRLELDFPAEIYLVVPTPPTPPYQRQDRPHVIVVQRAPAEGRAALVTAVKPNYPMEHLATYMPVFASKSDVILVAQLEMHCIPQTSELQCMIWHGDRQLTTGQQWHLVHGTGLEIIINPPLQTSNDATLWDADEDETALLQTTSRKTILLDTLVPHVEVVKLKAENPAQVMPTYVEIPAHTGAHGVQTELCQWSIHCDVYRFGIRNEYLCIDKNSPRDLKKFHYMLCHDDLSDLEGAILHSADEPLQQQQLMELLCSLEYPRAVILTQQELDDHLQCVRFLDCQPALQDDTRCQRSRTPWPPQHELQWRQQRLFEPPPQQDLDDLQKCSVQTPFQQEHIDELVKAGDHALCTDFSSLDLPDYIKTVMTADHVGALHDAWDRWLIFTDGSSQTKNKHSTPEFADAVHTPDAWAMLVIGEKFQEDGTSLVCPIGWTAHPVRTDPLGASYAGATRIGADVAEREGLLWAGLWRLTQNCITPTLFCVDSKTTSGQASGLLGVSEPDLSYRLLRGVFQCLQRGLPKGHVAMHHVRSHTGDPYNEFVDLIAKKEASSSFNLPRLQLNMQDWIPKIPHLWLRFSARFGLPAWNEGLHVPAPALPVAGGDSQTWTDKAAACLPVTFTCHLSLATINVLSLSKGPDGYGGKLKFLYDQVQAHGLNVIGVQEGRNEESYTTSHGIYRVCAGHSGGNYGVELWVNMKQPIAYDLENRPRFLAPHHLQVTYKDPQRLIVRCTDEVLSCWFFVAHAPHSGHPAQHRSMWWLRTDELINQHNDGAPWVWLIDANAAPGDADHVTVFTDGLATSANTNHFRQSLYTHGLCLPSTADCHSGTRATWTSFDGTQEHCIDYVVVPQDWISCCSFSGVIDSIELGNLKEDHMAVGLQLCWYATGLQETVPRKSHKLDWHQHEVREVLRDHIQNLDAAPWCTDVEQQAANLAAQLHVAMRKGPAATSVAKKPYISDAIWKMRAKKVHLRRRLRELNRRSGMHTLFAAFKTWTARPSDQEVQDFSAYSATLLCSKFKLLVAHQKTAHQLRKALRTAKQELLTERLDSMDETTPASGVLKCLKDFVGPTNLKQCKKKPVPLICNQEGQPCHLPSEALATWIDFFRDMEGGKRLQWSQLRKNWIDGLQAEQETHFQLSSEELPTLTDLELAMRRTACGKAQGADALPGELLHFFPTEIAELVFPTLWKLMLHGQEDLSYKGGVLVQAYKGRGDSKACHSFRSLLISSQIGKTIHRTIRTSQADLFEKFMQTHQVGGKRKMPVTYGLHLVRAHLRKAQRHNECAAIVFVDLTEAFYRIFRPLCMENDLTDEALAAFLKKLNMPDSALHELWMILGGPNALEMANLPYHLKKSIAAIHRNTHFWMRGQIDVVETRFGSRPGDPFADVCFSYVWARVLHRLQEHMEQNHLIDMYPKADTLCIFGDQSELRSGPDTQWNPFMGPTWMDDTAICLSATNTPDLISKATHTTSKLLELCTEHGMSPNLKRGKSEILLSLRGKDSRKHKIEMFGPHSTQTLPIITEHNSYQMPITNKYLHLGGLLHHGADQRVELRRRLATAHSAFNQHRRVLYHNTHISFTKRCELFQILIISKLLYGSESWLITDDRTVTAFHAAIYRLYRRLLRIPHDEHVFNEQLLAEVGLPSPDTLLRRQRLRYLGTLYRCGAAQDWGILNEDDDWRAYIEADLRWMWKQLHRSSDLPPPETHFAHWQHLILNHAKYWKRLIRRAVTHEILQTQRKWKVQEFHLRALRRFEQIFDVRSQSMTVEADEVDDASFGCMKCKLGCASKGGEAAHMFKCHGHVAATRQLFTEPICPACLKVFHTMQKTKAHIHYSQRCRQILRSHRVQGEVGPGAGSTHDRVLTEQHDRLLPPLQAAGPLNALPRLREDPGIDDTFFVYITDAIGPCMRLEDFVDVVKNYATDHAISWTAWCNTVRFFAESFDDDDAAFANLQRADMQDCLRSLCSARTFPFLKKAIKKMQPADTVSVLEQKCLEACRQPHVAETPRSFGKHRVLLHAYSGRRRPGDLQYYIDKIMAAKQVTFVLHVVSMDIVIDKVYGDARNAATRQYWLTAIKDRKVVAFIAGPPCETWTVARENALDDGRIAPRPVRSASELWGFECMTLRETCQVNVGNELLFFSLEALMELVQTDGWAIVEHPAPPNKEHAPSIWKLAVIQALLSLPQVDICRFCQGLLGAFTPKPTQLLLLNLPEIIFSLHRWRVRRELPRNTAIGLDSQGRWRTAPLKEYPPAMCGALAEALGDAFCTEPTADACQPSQSDLNLWSRLRGLKTCTRNSLQ